MSTLYQQWQNIAYDETADRSQLEKFWGTYFQIEKEIYEKLLSNPDEAVKGTVKELAEKFGQEVLTMIGFLDGINESLLIEQDLDAVEEDTVVSLAFDKERLYKNMVAAKADWLYELPQWKEIFSEEELKKFYKEQKESTTIRKPKKSEEMIHVRADQVKNTKNAVADNFSGSRYSESHLLRCDLYRTEKVGLYFFQILAGMRKYRNCRKCSDPFIWNAVDSRIADRYHGVPSFACRDEDHNRNVRKTFGKRSDGNR